MDAAPNWPPRAAFEVLFALDTLKDMQVVAAVSGAASTFCRALRKDFEAPMLETTKLPIVGFLVILMAPR